MLKKTSLGVWLMIFGWAISVEPVIAFHVGGYRTIFLLIFLGMLVARYQPGDIPVLRAIKLSCRKNSGLILLYLAFVVGFVFSAVRVWNFGNLVEWKMLIINIIALFFGMFFAANPHYFRFLVYVSTCFLLIHVRFSNLYVAVTGNDLREALSDAGGIMGHTDYWTNFGVYTLVLLAVVIKEREKWLKILGGICVAYFYYSITFCGFATPLGLFLLGNVVFGSVCLLYGKRGVVQWIIRFAFAVVLIAGTVITVRALAFESAGDDRFKSVQVRFKSVIENPQGGGYDVESSRFDLMYTGWKSFKGNPLFGAGGTYLNNPACGGHQALVDYLGIFGLLGGGGAFIMFIVLSMVKTWLRCRRERDWMAFASMAGVVICFLVGVVNPGWMSVSAALFIWVQPYKMLDSVKQRKNLAHSTLHPHFN